MAVSEALKKAQSKYMEKKKRYAFTLRTDHDTDVIKKLESVESKTGYIRDLIKADLERE